MPSPAVATVLALQGFMEYGSTSYPQALGLAATWDPAPVMRDCDVGNGRERPLLCACAAAGKISIRARSGGDQM